MSSGFVFSSTTTAAGFTTVEMADQTLGMNQPTARKRATMGYTTLGRRRVEKYTNPAATQQNTMENTRCSEESSSVTGVAEGLLSPMRKMNRQTMKRKMPMAKRILPAVLKAHSGSLEMISRH